MQLNGIFQRYRSAFAIAVLATWLLAPTGVAMWVSRMESGGWSVLGSAVFTVAILLAPLPLVGSARRLFLFWLPAGFAAPAYIYFTLFFHGVPGDGLMLSLLNTNVLEAREMLSGFGAITLALPLAWVCYALMAARLPGGPVLGAARRKQILAALLLYAFACVGALAWVGASDWAARGLPELASERERAISYPWGPAAALARAADALWNDADSDWQTVGATAPPDELLVVLVISESLRPDHLGINGYPRDTTPELAKLGNELLSFSDMASTANYTVGAVPNIIGRREGPGRVSLVSVFKEAGFRTAWISNQDKVIDPFADVTRFMETDWSTGIRHDSVLLPQLAECLQHCGSRKFITLHLMGSHFPYDARYGPSERKFTPTFAGREKKGVAERNKAELINSYDNTIVATDKLLGTVIAMARKSGKPALVIVTADHGENLYDDERKLVLHSGPKPSRADTIVPLLVWANDAYRHNKGDKLATLASHRAAPLSHLDIMPTVLDLAGVAYKGKKPEESFASPLFKPRKRLVLPPNGEPVDAALLR